MTKEQKPSVYGGTIFRRCGDKPMKKNRKEI